MSIATRLSRAQLAASINPKPERLADFLTDATLDYEEMLGKLDDQAGWIADKMQRLRVNIANSREAGPSLLSINGLGELQGRASELDRLCGEVTNQRALVRRLGQVLGVAA